MEERKSERAEPNLTRSVLALQQALALPPPISRDGVHLLDPAVLGLDVVEVVSRRVELSLETRTTATGLDDGLPGFLGGVGLAGGREGFGDLADAVGVLREAKEKRKRKGREGTVSFDATNRARRSFVRDCVDADAGLT